MDLDLLIRVVVKAKLIRQSDYTTQQSCVNLLALTIHMTYKLKVVCLRWID